MKAVAQWNSNKRREAKWRVWILRCWMAAMKFDKTDPFNCSAEQTSHFEMLICKCTGSEVTNSFPQILV